jgi:hypothetical protein
MVAPKKTTKKSGLMHPASLRAMNHKPENQEPAIGSFLPESEITLFHYLRACPPDKKI